MKLKVKNGLTVRNRFMNKLWEGLSIQSLKYLAFSVVLLFPLHAFAVGNAIKCTSENNLQRYNHLHEARKGSSNLIGIYHSLAINSLCLGKEAEGMAHLQKASDMGHAAAAYLLGIYYNTNKTFDNSQVADNPENWNAALHYYEKAAEIIESISNYPDKVMEFHERVSQTSYSVFTALPGLYFNGYSNALGEIIADKERVLYADSLEVLSKMRASAIRCLERPALSVWKEKKQLVYEAKQIKCDASLKFAENAYVLEQKRIQIAQSCQVPLGECSEHQGVINRLIQLARQMFEQKNSAPQF